MTGPTIFDSRDSRYKDPYGAVASGTKVTLTLRPPRAEGYSYTEIAQKLDISENSARVIEHRTRTWLKTMLQKEGYWDE